MTKRARLSTLTEVEWLAIVERIGRELPAAYNYQDLIAQLGHLSIRADDPQLLSRLFQEVQGWQLAQRQ